MSLEFQGIVLAAGKGVRMQSSLPKVLHKVCGMSLVAKSLRALAGAGCSKAIVVIGYGAELVTKEVSRLSECGEFGEMSVEFAVQECQRGTGDAVKAALPYLREAKSSTLAILPGDIPLIKPSTLQSGIAFHENQLENCKQKDPLSFLSFELQDPRGFGRVLRDKNSSVTAIVEEKDCDERERKIKEVNSGIYFGSQEFITQALTSLSCDNQQGEYYLTDIVKAASDKSIPVKALKILNSREVAGANSRFELSILEQQRRLEIAVELMYAGVSFEDPNAAYIDEGVSVSEDCFIGAGTRLKGKTSIGRGTILQGDSLVEDSVIGEQSLIKLGCSIESSKVGNQCHIGPFAHLRPGSSLEDQVHIGNFVEIKKSQLKSGVKAGHLSYLGDSLIEEEVNVGAGTITCNYDGINKHQTTIGRESFIGSNTCLVAPVELGQKSYIGAGSVITKNVPSGSLAVTRSAQKIKHDWGGNKSNKEKSQS